MALPLEGRVAIVTGASRGIGKGIAICLAQAGADVAVCARSDAAAANPLGSIEATAEAVRAEGRRALPVKLDVTDQTQIDAAVEAILWEFGRIDFLVNNAGLLGREGGAEYLGEDQLAVLDRYYQTNLRAPFAMTLAVAPTLIMGGGGVVVNISSGAATMPPPPGPNWQPGQARTNVGYGITKAALNRWVAGVAGELSQHQIAIVALDPGRTVVERNMVNPMPGVDYSTANTPETSGRATAFICEQGMRFSGQVLVSDQVVKDHGLTMTGMRPG